MIELVDTFPDIDVQPAEYKRLLGFPRGRVLEGRSRELADWARQWYAQHGRPWVYARGADSLVLTDQQVIIDGVAFSSEKLRSTLVQAGADSAVLIAVSAGPEVEAEAQRLWVDEKPDEYFFLEIFGTAIVEHLITTAGARLCGWAEAHSLAVLPHYSPGYDGWDIGQQGQLLELVKRTKHQPLPAALDVLSSGMLVPKKSQIAVFGLTPHTDRVRKLTDLVPCENCALPGCRYRRAPYRRAAEFAAREVPAAVEAGATPPPPVEEPAAEPLDLKAKYSVNVKAMRRWLGERLSLAVLADGTVEALFRYEGSTCSNMGRTLRFHYHVKLSPRSEGYVIRDMKCGPAPGDEGHRFMCRYMQNAEHLMVAIDHDKPLLGRKLNDVLAWKRPLMAPSCYCEPKSRQHKWGLVLETIHFALVQKQLHPEPEKPVVQETATR